MIALLPLVLALVLVGVGLRVGGSTDRRRVRREATWTVTVLVVFGALATFVDREVGWSSSWSEHGVSLVPLDWRLLTPLVDLLVALLAVALAPVRDHGPRTLSRILYVAAVTVATRGFEQGFAQALLWPVPLWIVWREFRDCGPDQRGTARMFARYHVPSAVLGVVGGLLLLTGRPEWAVWPWLLAIAVREAVVPLHGWLPVWMQSAPLGLVMVVVEPQLGVQLHLTTLAAVIPEGVAHGFAVAGAVTAILAAAFGLVQDEARRAVAWVVVSQTGLVAFGLENHALSGRLGAVLTAQVVALATTGLVMTLAALEARRGSLSLRVPGGSFDRTPRLAVAFLFLGFASVGLPLTLGFVAEDLLVQGSVDERPALVLALLVATAMNGMNVLRVFFALLSGRRDHLGEQDLGRREVFAVTVVMAVLLVGGLVPRWFVSGPRPPAAHHVEPPAAGIPHR
jgi:NADH-quinone oxidoreductase subunit M